MKKTYSKNPFLVKPDRADFRRRYPLLAGWKNLLTNALPFALLWWAGGINMLASALTAFFMMLAYVLNGNYHNNRRLSEMARKVREQGNA